MSRFQEAAEVKQHVTGSDSLQGRPKQSLHETAVVVKPMLQLRAWDPGNAGTMGYQPRKAVGMKSGLHKIWLHVLQVAGLKG